MSYKEDFPTNQSKQYNYYVDIAMELQGQFSREKINGMNCYEVRCPLCGRRKARMFPSERGDTYMFGCPVYGCKTDRGWGCSLHELITEHGSQDLQDRWNKERKWTGIKNRRPRGQTKPPLTDQERLQIRAMQERYKTTPQRGIQTPQRPRPPHHPTPKTQNKSESVISLSQIHSWSLKVLKLLTLLQ